MIEIIIVGFFITVLVYCLYDIIEVFRYIGMINIYFSLVLFITIVFAIYLYFHSYIFTIYTLLNNGIFK
jgi:hypothetical protein